VSPSTDKPDSCMKVIIEGTWKELFIHYIKNNIPERHEKGWVRKAACYTLLNGEHFKGAIVSPC